MAVTEQSVSELLINLYQIYTAVVYFFLDFIFIYRIYLQKISTAQNTASADNYINQL